MFEKHNYFTIDGPQTHADEEKRKMERLSAIKKKVRKFFFGFSILVSGTEAVVGAVTENPLHIFPAGFEVAVIMRRLGMVDEKEQQKTKK